jgi:hypothetical protein
LKPTVDGCRLADGTRCRNSAWLNPGPPLRRIQTTTPTVTPTMKRSAFKAQPPSTLHDVPKAKKARIESSSGNKLSLPKDHLKPRKLSKPAKPENTPPINRKSRGKLPAESDHQDGVAKNTPAKTADPLPTVHASTFKIIVGSYEKILYGLEATLTDDTPAASGSSSAAPIPALKPIFAFVAHVGYVKAVAASPCGGKWLATGSTDEVVKVWDLRRRKEIGALVQHKGKSTAFHRIESTKRTSDQVQ